MDQQDRAVSSVIATILMVAIAVLLAAAISVSFLDVAEDLREPAPNVADTTGEFRVTPPGERAGDKQIVRITHIAGDSININEIEIVVRASGPGSNLPREARLVNLPSDQSDIDEENIEGNDSLIDTSFRPTDGTGPPNLLITAEDSDVWSAGKTIQFRINTGGADFRDQPTDGDNEADTLEVVIVHTPSNSVLSEHTFTP